MDGLSESRNPLTGGTRSYDSPTRRAQAAETRAAIADAACALFVERGWSGTRVRDVAAAAGVSEPTVYAVYGSKAGLASALLDSVAGAVDFPAHMAHLEALKGHPARQIAVLAAIDREIFEHGADAITVIRDAGRENAELAAVYAKGRERGQQARSRVFSSWDPSVWREGVTLDLALDCAAALLTVDTYLVLTRERGWSADQVQRWWADTLAHLLLGEASRT